jgi:hypothetical protein
MVKITPAQLEFMKREACWFAASRHLKWYSCTILMMQTSFDMKNSVYEVITVSEQLNIVDRRTGLSYTQAIDTIANQMKEEESW